MSGRSTSRSSVRPTVGPSERGPDTTLGKRPSPTRLLRLSRALVNLAEHEIPRDRADDDDPWPDIPEELDPVDDDAVEDEDFLPGVKSRQRPAITYSRATPWPVAGDAASADRFSDSDLRVTVRRPARSAGSDPATEDLAAEELQRIAAALDDLQSNALRASSRLGAFECLEPISEKQLATQAAVSPSVLSRRRREVIEAPWGVAPLAFYWWKRKDGLDLTEARLLARVLQREPELEDRTVARRVAEHSAGPVEVAHRIDTIRKQVPIMRALLPLLPTLNLLSETLTEIDPEEVDELIEAALGSRSSDGLARRGRALVQMALVGAFDDLSNGS